MLFFALRKTLPALLSLLEDNSALTPIGSGSLQLPGGEPQAEAAEVVNEAQVSVESYRGNAVTKNAEPDNPAVHNAQPENDVAKKPSEIEVEQKDSENTDASKKRDEDKEMKDAEKRDGDGDGDGEGEGEGEGKPEENGEVKVGEKRQHDAIDKEENGEKNAEAEAEANAEEAAVKKQKTDDGNVKKSRGRPKKSEANGTSKKTPTKKREPKKAATQTGEPRRSARHKSS